MASTGSRLDLHSLKMLVLEPNSAAMDVMSQIIMGFGVKEATKTVDLAQSIQFLNAFKFDLVVAANDISTRSGLRLLRHIRSEPSSSNYTVPFILLSTSISESAAVEARDSGANFIVAKPLVPRVLLSRVEWIARSHRNFITSESYRGPDRRFKVLGPPGDIEERRSDMLKLVASPDRELAQTEIDSLFG